LAYLSKKTFRKSLDKSKLFKKKLRPKTRFLRKSLDQKQAFSKAFC